MDKPKNHGGRPSLPEDKRLVQRSIRLTPAQWAKIDAAGLPALRKLLDRWRAPEKAG